MKVILALQPTGNQVGYAIFNDTFLIASGCKNLGKDSSIGFRIHRVAIPFFRRLIEEYSPTLVVLPSRTVYPHTGRNRFLRALQYELRRDPRDGIAITRKTVRSCFKSFTKEKRISKDAIMELLVKWFPQLRLYLPSRRRAWDAEDYWVPMFDAVALAVTHLNQL